YFSTIIYLLWHQVHSTNGATSRLIFFNLRMHGTCIDCVFNSRRLFYKVHPTYGAISGLIVCFITLAMHGAVINSVSISFSFFSMLFMIMLFGIFFIGMNMIIASGLSKSLLKFSNRKVLIHFYNSFTFFQIYFSIGYTFCVTKCFFNMRFSPHASHSCNFIYMFHLFIFLVCALFKRINMIVPPSLGKACFKFGDREVLIHFYNSFTFFQVYFGIVYAFYFI